MNLYCSAGEPIYRLLLCVWRKVADEWQKSLGYVRGSNIYVRGLFEFMYLVFKTTCIDRRKPLREGAFFFTRRMLIPPLNKRNTRDKAKGLCITSGRPIGGLGVRYLSALNLSRE